MSNNVRGCGHVKILAAMCHCLVCTQAGHRPVFYLLHVLRRYVSRVVNMPSCVHAGMAQACEGHGSGRAHRHARLVPRCRCECEAASERHRHVRLVPRCRCQAASKSLVTEVSHWRRESTPTESRRTVPTYPRSSCSKYSPEPFNSVSRHVFFSHVFFVCGPLTPFHALPIDTRVFCSVTSAARR